MIKIQIGFGAMADIKPGEVPELLRLKHGPYISSSYKDVTKEEIEALENFLRSLEKTPDEFLNRVRFKLDQARKQFPDLS